MRVPFDDVVGVLRRALEAAHMDPERADRSARLFAEASRDGVYSHGLNRFPRFLRTIANGVVDVRARPVLAAAAGAIERWDGRRGPGNLNAFESMGRAIELSRRHGIGCVALRNTNHWMRGGSYGWQAADAGAIAICWTNTLPNLPPWGAAEPRVGNNPLVLAVPRTQGHVVLDMATSQFSVGALTAYAARGERLPVDGGYDAEGRLTSDPSAILASGRLLPIGFWKGSGLSILLDVIAASLAAGRATYELNRDPVLETSLSQVFVAVDPASLGAPADGDRLADAVVASIRGSGEAAVRYPGERVLADRSRSAREGVFVDDEIWSQIRAAAR